MKPERLGDRLRRLRSERDLTIEEVARRLDVSPSTYREWENGRAIRGEPYIKMRDLFQVSLEELLAGKKGDRGKILGELDEIERHVNILRSELLKCV
jgi:transcriptional regulator with XRE-family HTH domain